VDALCYAIGSFTDYFEPSHDKSMRSALHRLDVKVARIFIPKPVRKIDTAPALKKESNTR
jgi:hypothetical protein